MTWSSPTTNAAIPASSHTAPARALGLAGGGVSVGGAVTWPSSAAFSSTYLRRCARPSTAPGRAYRRSSNCLQVTQRVADGNAASRSTGIGLPHRSHQP